MFEELRGKVAIVTGAGSVNGIGRAIARRFAEAGMKVVLNDINEAQGEANAQAIRDEGGEAVFALGSVGVHAHIKRTVNRAIKHFGRLDVVVNNAYSSTHKDVVALSTDEWDRDMAVMLKSAFLFGKHAFPHMVKLGGGSMVNISSVHGLMPAARYPVYAAAKGGLINLSRQMAIDGGPHNIRVNVICPGAINTQSVVADLPRGPDRRSSTPMRRAGQPDEIAKAALFLVSDLASYVTGATLLVDGGMTAQLQDSMHWTKGLLAFTDEPEGDG